MGEYVGEQLGGGRGITHPNTKVGLRIFIVGEHEGRKGNRVTRYAGSYRS